MARAIPLERALGIRFRNRRLLEMALTHRSYAFEQNLDENNERLEFLGDAVLGLVVTDLAYRRFPDLAEGELAKLRAAIVNMATLADVARELGLGRAVLLGRGEEGSGGRDKPSILGDAFEALLGALYLDRGVERARAVIERLFSPRIDAYTAGGGERDYKTGLQELAARGLNASPEYRVSEAGPDHDKRFRATVILAGRTYGAGEGRSKKEAEQRAARTAYERLSRRVGAGRLAEGRRKAARS